MLYFKENFFHSINLAIILTYSCFSYASSPVVTYLPSPLEAKEEETNTKAYPSALRIDRLTHFVRINSPDIHFKYIADSNKLFKEHFHLFSKDAQDSANTLNLRQKLSMQQKMSFSFFNTHIDLVYRAFENNHKQNIAPSLFHRYYLGINRRTILENESNYYKTINPDGFCPRDEFLTFQAVIHKYVDFLKSENLYSDAIIVTKTTSSGNHRPWDHVPLKKDRSYPEVFALLRFVHDKQGFVPLYHLLSGISEEFADTPSIASLPYGDFEDLQRRYIFYWKRDFEKTEAKGIYLNLHINSTTGLTDKLGIVNANGYNSNLQKSMSCISTSVHIYQSIHFNPIFRHFFKEILEKSKRDKAGNFTSFIPMHNLSTDALNPEFESILKKILMLAQATNAIDKSKEMPSKILDDFIVELLLVSYALDASSGSVTLLETETAKSPAKSKAAKKTKATQKTAKYKQDKRKTFTAPQVAVGGAGGYGEADGVYGGATSETPRSDETLAYEIDSELETETLDSAYALVALTPTDSLLEDFELGIEVVKVEEQPTAAAAAATDEEDNEEEIHLTAVVISPKTHQQSKLEFAGNLLLQMADELSKKRLKSHEFFKLIHNWLKDSGLESRIISHSSGSHTVLHLEGYCVTLVRPHGKKDNTIGANRLKAIANDLLEIASRRSKKK